jgi:hypothetical protein
LTELDPAVFATTTALTLLDISNNYLTSLPASIFASLTLINELFINGNLLTDLPPGIFSHTTRLLLIDLKNNRLTHLDPQLFASLQNLQDIYIDSNRLQVLDDSLFSNNLQLNEVRLSHNAITALTNALFRMNGNITRLLVSRNNIVAIPNVLSSLSLIALEMAGNPSTCTKLTATYRHPNQTLICQCAPGFVQTTNALCENASKYVSTPQFGSLRGKFQLQGPSDQFTAQVDTVVSAQFLWNEVYVVSPDDTNITLHWLPGSNSTGIFSPYFDISVANWATICSNRMYGRLPMFGIVAVCERMHEQPCWCKVNTRANNTILLVHGEPHHTYQVYVRINDVKPPSRYNCGDIVYADAPGGGQDDTSIPAQLEYNVIGPNGDAKRVNSTVNLVYSAFHARGTFDVAFDQNIRTDVAAALGRQPRRVRIQQGYDANMLSATQPDNYNADVLQTVANVTANVNIPSSISFQLIDSTCMPATNLRVQQLRSNTVGTLDGWEVVVGGIDLQATHMPRCTAVLQAVDSVSNEVLNVTTINATVADCFDGETTTAPAATSCSGHGRCSVDPTPDDGYFAGCDCDAGYIGERCDEELVVCQPIKGRKTALVRGQCKPFILHTNESGERNTRPEFANGYTNPTTFKGPFIVGDTYRIAALKLNTSSTIVSDGTFAEIKYTLGQGAPPGFFVSSNNGEILAQFDQPGQYNVSLLAVDKSGLEAVMEPMAFVAAPKPVFHLVLVPRKRTESGPQFTDPDAKSTEYVVQESYRIAPRQINAGATKVSSGLVANITYTLAGAPSSWFVSATTGEIFGLFPKPKVYSFSLLALDADQQVQTMENFTFNVVTPRTFGTSLYWNPETMMTQTIQSRYELGKTFAIPGPILPRNELFIHASQNDYTPNGITYLLDCIPLSQPRAGAAPIAPAVLNDADSGQLQCPQFFVDTVSGAMLVNMSFAGRFSVKLVAKDATGHFADVKAWNFSTLPLSIANDQKYGPNHKGCGRGIKVAGPDIFTSPFTCNCLGTGNEGANCQTHVKDAGKLSGLIGDATAGVLLAAVIIAGLIMYRRRAKLNAPYSFQKMVESLTVAEMVSLGHCVKEQLREMGNIVEGSVTDDVADNSDVQLLDSGTSDDNELLLIDLDTNNANEASIPLMSLGLKPRQVLRVPIEIELSRLEIRSSIGKGVSGDVSRGLLRNTRFGGTASTMCAVKQPKRGSSSLEKVALLQEAALMAQFTHQNVVQLLGVVTRNQQYMLVIELCEYGALCDLLNREVLQPAHAHTINVATVLEIAGDVVQGMVYLSKQHFVHRDLASRNILYDQQQVCKVADFGLSRLLADTKHYYYVKHRGGSPLPLRWTAPEVLAKGKFSTKSDVWSFVQCSFLWQRFVLEGDVGSYYMCLVQHYHASRVSIPFTVTTTNSFTPLKGVFLYEVLSRAVVPFVGCSNVHVIDLLMSSNVTSLMHAQFVLPFQSAETIYRELILPCWHREREDRTDFTTLASSCKRLVGERGVQNGQRRPAFAITAATWRTGVGGSSSSGDGGGSGSGGGGARNPRVAYLTSSIHGSSGGGSEPTSSTGESDQFNRSDDANNGSTTDAFRGQMYKNVARVPDGAGYAASLQVGGASASPTAHGNVTRVPDGAGYLVSSHLQSQLGGVSATPTVQLLDGEPQGTSVAHLEGKGGVNEDAF